MHILSIILIFISYNFSHELNGVHSDKVMGVHDTSLLKYENLIFIVIQPKKLKS